MIWKEIDVVYFECVWGKKSTRKHKKWEGDGLLRVGTSTVLLIDEEGKELGKGSGYNTSQLAELEDGGRCVDHFTFPIFQFYHCFIM